MGEELLEPLLGMVVLVTGATGFIGRHLCRHLAGAGARIHAVSRSAQPTTAGIEQWHTVDLSDTRAVDTLIETVRPDYVFHLASHVTGSRSLSEVRVTFASNLLSTVNLLQSIAGTPCKRLVLAGSLEETDAPGEAPSSPYAAAKASATLYARMFHQLYQTPVTTARLFMVYGPDQPDRRKLVPYVAESLLKGESPRLGSGVRPVDWVHVSDVVEALACCATAPGLDGETIEIGTGKLTTVRSVAERISDLVGVSRPVFGEIEDRPVEQVRAADPTRARELMGRDFTPLDQGLEQTVQWYREHLEA